MEVLKRGVEGRYLRATSGSKIPQYIMVFDTETEYITVENEQRHKMKIGWSVFAHVGRDGEPTHETWRYWTKRYPLCEYMANMAELTGELTIVGNNVFFDLQVCGFFATMPEMGWTMDFFYENGMSYILCIKNGRAKIKCISLTNYFEASVKTLGEMIGKPKMKIQFGSETAEELSIYCFRDTEITYEAFLEYVKYIITHDLGSFSLTRASQSMKAFRHRFMSHKIMYHTDEELSLIEMDSYFGGRTECYRIGQIPEGPFVDLDVNSLYPFIMKEKQMPLKAVDYYRELNVYNVADLLSAYGMIARVTVSTDEPCYPYRFEKKVLFPIGTFETTLCTESIRYALEHGHLNEIKDCITYEMGNPFVQYVDYFYKERLRAKSEGNKVYDKMAKLFMNSLYGKFAAQRDVVIVKQEAEVSDYMREEIYDSVTGENQIISKLFATLIVTQGKEVIPGSVIAIPSHVTEYARNYLWSIIKTIGREKVFYCDTDSVKIRESDMTMAEGLLHETELGKLKVESKYSTLLIHGPKDYETDTTRKLKGVPRTAERVNDSTWKYSQFNRQITHMREGNNTYFTITSIEKNLKRVYTKGKVDSTGMVTPFTLPLDSWLLKQRP